MKTFLQKAFAVLTAVCACVLVTSCSVSSSGSFITNNCISNQTNTSFFMSYAYLDGSKTYNINFDAPAEMKISFTTKSGDLSCVITDRSGNYLYRGNKIETCSFSVGVPAAGVYTVKLTAAKHEGSFSFDWGK